MDRVLDTVSFREIQRFRQPLLWVLLGTTAIVVIGLMGYGLFVQLILGRPWGNNPVPDGVLVAIAGSAILIMVAVVWLMYAARLITEVRISGLYVRFFPFHRAFQKVDLRNVTKIEVRTYQPIRDYGGWGIKNGLRGKVYNVYGNRGVHLSFPLGTDLMIGSQRPEELARAIELTRHA